MRDLSHFTEKDSTQGQNCHCDDYSNDENVAVEPAKRFDCLSKDDLSDTRSRRPNTINDSSDRACRPLAFLLSSKVSRRRYADQVVKTADEEAKEEE